MQNKIFFKLVCMEIEVKFLKHWVKQKKQEIINKCNWCCLDHGMAIVKCCHFTVIREHEDEKVPRYDIIWQENIYNSDGKLKKTPNLI